MGISCWIQLCLLWLLLDAFVLSEPPCSLNVTPTRRAWSSENSHSVPGRLAEEGCFEGTRKDHGDTLGGRRTLPLPELAWPGRWSRHLCPLPFSHFSAVQPRSLPIPILLSSAEKPPMGGFAVLWGVRS